MTTLDTMTKEKPPTIKLFLISVICPLAAMVLIVSFVIYAGNMVRVAAMGDATHPLVSDEHLLLERGPVVAHRDGDRVTIYAVVSERASDRPDGPVRSGRVVTIEAPASAVSTFRGTTVGAAISHTTWLDVVEEGTGRPVTLGTLGDRDAVRASSVRVGDLAYAGR